MAHTEQGNNNQNILHILQMSVIALSTSTYKLYTTLEGTQKVEQNHGHPKEK